MSHSKFLAGSLLIACFITACNSSETKQEASDSTATTTPASALKEETVTIQADGANLISYLVYDDSIKTKRPAVLVIPEWWGLNDYPKMRARELARLGYVALAVDIFGDGKIADNPDSAGAFATPFYKHPEKAKARIDAAIAKVKTYPQVDTAISAHRLLFWRRHPDQYRPAGDELKAIVSFHGSLLGTPAKKGC